MTCVKIFLGDGFPNIGQVIVFQLSGISRIVAVEVLGLAIFFVTVAEKQILVFL